MELPTIVQELIKTQNSYDSTAYSNCFTEDAIVQDEGKTHAGKGGIKHWNENTGREYGTVLEPKSYEETEAGGILSAIVSGTFIGSPIELKFHFIFRDGLIYSLWITG